MTKLTYKITDTNNPNWAVLKNFNSLQDAQTFTNNLGSTFSVKLAPNQEQIPKPTPQEKLQNDIQIGNQLIEMFLIDNRLITPIVTPAESIQLLTQFETTEKLARLGDIKSVKTLLENMVTDPRLFTDERKDKYLSMINNYINS